MLEDFVRFVFSSENPRLAPAKLRLLERLGKALGEEKSVRKMSKGLFEALLALHIPFTELELKKEEKEARKKEDFDLLRRLRRKQKLTFKQEQIVRSKGFHKRVKTDALPKDKETQQLEKKIARRNKTKKTERFNRRLLETFYAVALKIVRLHFKRPVLAVGLKALMRFINRMPAKFVAQVLVNLRSIYALAEADAPSEGSLSRKLKLLRAMLSLWKKLNFEGQLENHFLQERLYRCFLDVLAAPVAFDAELLEDLFVNFDNLAMKTRVSDSNVVCNWFVLLARLAARLPDARAVNVSLFLMSKMVGKYEKLLYYFDDSGRAPTLAASLTAAEDKSASLRKPLSELKLRLGGNNRAKHFVECLLEKKPPGKKYIGMDLRAFLATVSPMKQ